MVRAPMSGCGGCAWSPLINDTTLARLRGEKLPHAGWRDDDISDVLMRYSINLCEQRSISMTTSSPRHANSPLPSAGRWAR
jgi:hypothetical protein